jgi:hypothetical protein
VFSNLSFTPPNSRANARACRFGRMSTRCGGSAESCSVVLLMQIRRHYQNYILFLPLRSHSSLKQNYQLIADDSAKNWTIYDQKRHDLAI